ncbi:hypothetical protein GCM10009092_45510 [Bowmanella denitrificans]|uniref:Anti-sigma factor n=1 Tax=Bowmanella denitrificans TaxID=366582 RepID=A0ABP3HPZ9_9ALTE
MSDKHELFALWLEGRLSAEQQQIFERLCAEDDELARQVSLARQVEQAATRYEEQAVPNWQIPAIGPQPRAESSWWRGRAMPSLSFAMSIVALAMVLFRVEVQVHGGSLTVSFAGQGREDEIRRQVDAEIAQFKEQQQVLLANYSREMREQQQDVNSQLTSYLLSASRTERREDFAELIKFVNQQREDDQQFYARQFNKLQQQVYLAPETGQRDNLSPIK